MSTATGSIENAKLIQIYRKADIKRMTTKVSLVQNIVVAREPDVDSGENTLHVTLMKQETLYTIMNFLLERNKQTLRHVLSLSQPTSILNHQYQLYSPKLDGISRANLAGHILK